jgi:hypothetical protein
MLFINVMPLTSFAISALEGLAPTTAQILGAELTGLALIGNNLTVARSRREIFDDYGMRVAKVVPGRRERSQQ